jgi:hypothetical protein
LGNTDLIILNIFAPIAEFANATNIISSTQAQFQSGAFKAVRSGAANQAFNMNNATQKVLFNSVSDNTGFQKGLVYDAANSQFVCTIPGNYFFSASTNFSATNVVNTTHALLIRVNSVSQYAEDRVPPAASFFALQVNGNVVLNAGDIVDVALFSAANYSVNNLTMTGGGAYSYFTGYRIPDLSVVGISGAPVEVLSAVSNFKSDIPASLRWLQHTGNSLTLSPGVWKVFVTGEFSFATSSVNYKQIRITLKTANGNDTSTEPSDALLAGNSYLNNVIHRQGIISFNTNVLDVEFKTAGPIYISVTQTQTVFAVAFVEFSGTASNARVKTALVAERIR